MVGLRGTENVSIIAGECSCLISKMGNHTKYALEALRLQYQVKSVLSPQLVHRILWDRFVNTRGGLGHNVPCDLYNEHVNKLLIGMGSILTEASLQRAAHCKLSVDSLTKSEML